MTQPEVLQALIGHLAAELETLTRAAKASYSAATDPDSRAENKYDTRTLEASYVARGQAQRVAELGAALQQFQALTAATPGAVVQLGSLISLRTPNDTLHFFLGPAAGGSEVTLGSDSVQVITPASPLGQKLIGKRAGDSIPLNAGIQAHVLSVK
jgi:transcription elongation GreA/GreB family factor